MKNIDIPTDQEQQDRFGCISFSFEIIKNKIIAFEMVEKKYLMPNGKLNKKVKNKKHKGTYSTKEKLLKAMNKHYKRIDKQ